MSFMEDTQANQWVFWATGDAAYVQWSSDAARDAFTKRVQEWYNHAATHDGVFPDGSRVDPMLPQPDPASMFPRKKG